MHDLIGLEIDEALGHRDLLGSAVRDPKTWAPWRAFLKTIYSRPLNDDERALYTRCTGREEPPGAPISTVSLVCGRRSGKSAVAAAVAVYEACFRDWRPRLSPGEHAVVLVLATTTQQATVIMRYVKGLIAASPLLSAMVHRETESTLELKNSAAITVSPTNFRSVRGRSVAVALFDECAFWRDQDSGSNPDREVLAAVRASQATFGDDAKLIMLSSPYRRSGILFNHWKRHYGQDDARNLSWTAPTRLMNPSVPQSFIDEAFENDPESAQAEFGDLENGISFRSDLASYVDRELVERLVVEDRFELPPVTGQRYTAFCDPAGGSGSDSMTLAICHREGETVVLDSLREVKPKFNPNDVCGEFAQLLRSYRVFAIRGDRYAGSWVSERFMAHGIRYEPAELTKNEIYKNALPLLTSGRAELLDHKRLIMQLVALERRTGRGSRDTIDHPTGGHDDVANAVAGALVLSVAQQGARVTVTPLRI